MTILLPCYNEETSIRNVLININKNFPDSKIIIVDDGSTDRTYEAIKNTEEEFNLNITILKHKKNKGLGKALSTGLNYIIKNFDNGYLIILDADETHPIEIIHQMLKKIKSENLDIVIASRYIKEGKQINLSFMRNILSRIFSLLFHLFYPEITDFSSGFRCYSIKFLKKNFIKFNLDKGFASSFEILINLIRKKAKIKEVPLILDYSKKTSSSKFNFKKVLFSYIRIMIKLI